MQNNFTTFINSFYNFYYEKKTVHSKRLTENENYFRKAGHVCRMHKKWHFWINLQEFKCETVLCSMQILKFLEWKNVQKNIKKAIEGTCQPFDIGKKCYHRIYPFKKNLKN